MLLDELRPGLWRWTALHPDAVDEPTPGSPDDWGPDVGCVACAARGGGAVVAIDPLVPADEDRFWAEVDAVVERHGPSVSVITTVRWHHRSRAAFVERYGASTSRAKAALPAGVRTVRVPRAGEVMVWLQDHGALVPGDRLLGDDAGGVRLCPPSWLRYLDSGITQDELRVALEPLRELPIEMVLVSHGEPVLQDGARAVERALAPTP